MSEVHPGAGRHESGDIAPTDAPKWLGMMATPAFAIMALLTAVHDGGQANVLCSAAPEGLALSGMTLMYILMSAFHATPWLKLMSRRQK